MCVSAVWVGTGAEVSDCLVSVGSKLWPFAPAVNFEEFLMELWSCQTSESFFKSYFFFIWKRDSLNRPVQAYFPRHAL